MVEGLQTTAQGRLRYYLDLVEAAQKEWTVAESPLFRESLDRALTVFPDIRDRLTKFVSVKRENPLQARYGKHDKPLTGYLVGFWDCHLRDDAVLIYTLQGRTILLVYIASHAEMEGKRKVKLAKKLAPYNQRK